MTERGTTEKKEAKVEELKKLADERSCPVQKAFFYITEFLAGPMCGRCFPCALGSYEARIRLGHIIDGKGVEGDILALSRIAGEMLEASMCKKGKETARFVLDWMNTGAYTEHVHGRCPDGGCTAFVEYRVVPEKCTMCGLCRDACKFGAIFGEKKKPYLSGYLPFEIRQKKCLKCDE